MQDDVRARCRRLECRFAASKPCADDLDGVQSYILESFAILAEDFAHSF